MKLPTCRGPKWVMLSAVTSRSFFYEMARAGRHVHAPPARALPAAWQSLKTTNCIESLLAQVGHRTDKLAPFRRRRDETGVSINPRPTSGTIDGAPNTQTLSRAEHGSGGRF